MSLKISYFEFRQGESKEHSGLSVTEIQRSKNSKEQFKFFIEKLVKP